MSLVWHLNTVAIFVKTRVLRRLLAAGALLLVSTVHAALPFQLGQNGQLPTLADMLEEVNPAIVNIATSARATYRNPLLEDPFFRRFFRVPKAPSRPRSSGSGVVVDAGDGYIVTNSHVIEGADLIEVGLSDGRTLVAKLVGSDPQVDLAVLKVEPAGLADIEIANSARLRVGDFVVAIGNPFNLKHTVTSGIVSALGRSGLGIEGYEDFIQTDASINPGNSGGALVDLRGDLVGINTAILAPTGTNVGIGFAIPSNMVRAIMEQIIEHGEVRRGLIGVAVQDLHPDLAEAFDVDAQDGVIVTRVEDGSPGEAAGIREGDIVSRIGEREITRRADFLNQAAVLFIGDVVDVELIRGGSRRTVELSIGEDTQNQVHGRQLDERLDGVQLENFWSPDEPGISAGVLVADLDTRSKASAYGLRQGDLIVGINRRNVGDIADMRDVLQLDKRGMRLSVYRDGQFGVINIR